MLPPSFCSMMMSLGSMWKAALRSSALIVLLPVVPLVPDVPPVPPLVMMRFSQSAAAGSSNMYLGRRRRRRRSSSTAAMPSAMSTSAAATEPQMTPTDGGCAAQRHTGAAGDARAAAPTGALRLPQRSQGLLRQQRLAAHGDMPQAAA